MEADEKLSNLATYFSLIEPALFLLMMKLERVAVLDEKVTVALNVKPSKIELIYNREFVDHCPNNDLSNIVLVELTRLLLQHPTLRVKDDRKMSYEASNFTMHDYYSSNPIADKLPAAPEPRDTFEEYYWYLLDNIASGKGGGQGGGGNGDGNGKPQPSNLGSSLSNSAGNSQGWNKNDVLAEQIKDFVREHEAQLKQSSFIGRGKAIEYILKANAKSEVSPEKLLRTFVAQIESERKFDTRMKVNRRYGLEQPGYKRDVEYDVLIGVDVSGSISNGEIKRFANIITATAKAAFVSTVSWDTEVYEKKPISLQHYRKPKIKIAAGGGGTNPEAFLKYAKERGFTNVIIPTDGCFGEITSTYGLKICWVCTEKPSNEKNLRKTGKYILLGKKHKTGG